MIGKISAKKLTLYILVFILLSGNLAFNFIVLNGPKDPTIRFGDLDSIFRASICYEKIGIGVYQETSYECGYIYGRFFLVLMNFFNLGNFGITNLLIIGIFQSTCLLLAILYLLWELKKFENKYIGISVIMFFSPGVLFLIERGNLDVTMILLITTSFLLYGKNVYLSWAFLALSSSFKFYSIPLLFLSSILQKNLRKRIILLIFSTAVAIILTMDLIKFHFAFPMSLFLGFGAPLIPGWINLLLDHQGLISFRISTGLGYFISTLLVGCFSLFFRRFIQLKQSLVPGEKGQTLLVAFIFAATVYLSCYFVGFSYDIRLIYLAACLSILLAIIELSRKFLFFVFINILSAFWIGAQFGLNFSSFQSFNVVSQAIGDLSILLLTSIIFIVFLKGIYLLNKESRAWGKFFKILRISQYPGPSSRLQ